MSSEKQDDDGITQSPNKNIKNKRAKLKHDWQNGSAVVVAPVYFPKNINAKFAFPADLVYDNLAALLGLIQNPWTTTEKSSPSAPSNREEAASSAGVKPNEILRELCVTPEMCSAYVKYRRFGTRQSDCMEFMIRAAAPTDMVETYDFEHKRKMLRERVRNYVNHFWSSGCRDAHTEINYFSSWFADSGLGGHGRIRLHGGEAFVILHDNVQSIEALRERMRRKIRRIAGVSDVLKQKPEMEEALVAIMRDQTLPFYDVPLLKEQEV